MSIWDVLVDDVLRTICSEWLVASDIVKLDGSLCNKEKRKSFLSFLERSRLVLIGCDLVTDDGRGWKEFLFDTNAKRNASKLTWLESRHLAVDHLTAIHSMNDFRSPNKQRSATIYSKATRFTMGDGIHSYFFMRATSLHRTMKSLTLSNPASFLAHFLDVRLQASLTCLTELTLCSEITKESLSALASNYPLLTSIHLTSKKFPKILTIADFLCFKCRLITLTCPLLALGIEPYNTQFTQLYPTPTYTYDLNALRLTITHEFAQLLSAFPKLTSLSSNLFICYLFSLLPSSAASLQQIRILDGKYYLQRGQAVWNPRRYHELTSRLLTNLIHETVRINVHEAEYAAIQAAIMTRTVQLNNFDKWYILPKAWYEEWITKHAVYNYKTKFIHSWMRSATTPEKAKGQGQADSIQTPTIIDYSSIEDPEQFGALRCDIKLVENVDYMLLPEWFAKDYFSVFHGIEQLRFAREVVCNSYVELYPMRVNIQYLTADHPTLLLTTADGCCSCQQQQQVDKDYKLHIEYKYVYDYYMNLSNLYGLLVFNPKVWSCWPHAYDTTSKVRLWYLDNKQGVWQLMKKPGNEGNDNIINQSSGVLSAVAACFTGLWSGIRCLSRATSSKASKLSANASYLIKDLIDDQKNVSIVIEIVCQEDAFPMDDLIKKGRIKAKV